MAITVLVPSAVVTCRPTPLRAEMMPSISGPSAISAASGEGELYTAAEMSASDGSCCCAAKLADAVPVSMASRKRSLGLLELTPIAVLLQTRSVGVRDRRLSSDRRPVRRVRVSEPSPLSAIERGSGRDNGGEEGEI